AGRAFGARLYAAGRSAVKQDRRSLRLAHAEEAGRDAQALGRPGAVARAPRGPQARQEVIEIFRLRENGAREVEEAEAGVAEGGGRLVGAVAVAAFAVAAGERGLKIILAEQQVFQRPAEVAMVAVVDLVQADAARPGDAGQLRHAPRQVV